MHGIFANYKKNDKTLPDNTNVDVKDNSEYKDVITRGSTCRHQFSIHHASENVDDILITYAQGTETILTLTFDDVVIQEKEFKNLGYNNYFVIKWVLSEDQTLLFNDYNKQTTIQIKLFLHNGSISQSPIYKVKVLPTLDNSIRLKEDEK